MVEEAPEGTSDGGSEKEHKVAGGDMDGTVGKYADDYAFGWTPAQGSLAHDVAAPEELFAGAGDSKEDGADEPGVTQLADGVDCFNLAGGKAEEFGGGVVAKPEDDVEEGGCKGANEALLQETGVGAPWDACRLE